MNLANPFPEEVRNLYLGDWSCRVCGGNGQDAGGLALHHIVGRSSDSAFNSCLVCGNCHSKMNHNQEEERELFAKTFAWLFNMRYNIQQNDMKFLAEHFDRLNIKELWATSSSKNKKSKNQIY
jgi:hypothetical protein